MLVIFGLMVMILRVCLSMKSHFLRRQIGMVHQDYRLLTDRSVAENVALPLIIAGMNPKEAHTRALVALDRVGLRSKANYMPPQISGGEQQRVGYRTCNRT